MKVRGSGVLLHITSLPSPYGIGDLGPSAYQFADLLAEMGQAFWQILPLNPTSVGHGNSPYSSHSVFAGNPLLISPDLLVRDGLLQKTDLEDKPAFNARQTQYEEVSRYKYNLLRLAYNNFKKKMDIDPEFNEFCIKNSVWIEDYALYGALKEQFKGAPWTNWPPELKLRNDGAISEWQIRLAPRIAMERFFQYAFFKQWESIKHYCNQRNIQIKGDMPIYVNHDSPDVWVHPEIFKLNEDRESTFIAGVPPDYFSSTGQLWGNPVYNWDVLKKSRYAWWADRLEQNFKLYDRVRLDHFRGFVAYWEVKAGEKTAMNGKWVIAPARDFFNTMFRRFPCLPVVAEDLGYITADVREVISHYGFPTMKVLLFAFSGDIATNPYVPNNHVRNCVVYTGTHDNNTVRGWFSKETTPEDRKQISKYLGRAVSEDNVNWEFIRMAMTSVADVSIIPLQDILGLGEEARMNRPSVSSGNWAWRFLWEDLNPDSINKFSEMTRTYARG